MNPYRIPAVYYTRILAPHKDPARILKRILAGYLFVFFTRSLQDPMILITSTKDPTSQRIILGPFIRRKINRGLHNSRLL